MGTYLIPTEKILERIRFENPWWVTDQIPESIRQLSKRLYFHRFFPHVIEQEIRRAVLLLGPRRVGKTVMLFHSIQQLIGDSTFPHCSVVHFNAQHIKQHH